MGKRGPQPKHNVSTQWSADLAYAVGLIATDGCLYNDGRHVNLTSKDIQMIKTFRSCLGLTNTIGRKSSGFVKEKRYHVIQFADVSFYNFLMSIGLTPAKSKTIGQLQIPDKHFAHFLRGSFDGDGSFYSYQDPRWPTSLMYYLQFSSASLRHLEWLQETTTRLYSCTGHLICTRPSGVFNLRFAKRETRLLSKTMYPSAAIPHLKRKRDKIAKVFKIV